MKRVPGIMIRYLEQGNTKMGDGGEPSIPAPEKKAPVRVQVTEEKKKKRSGTRPMQSLATVMFGGANTKTPKLGA